MLIYVIPFILLLVIAIVLKKREASKQAEQTSTAKAKTKGKKVSSTKKTPQKNFTTFFDFTIIQNLFFLLN